MKARGNRWIILGTIVFLGGCESVLPEAHPDTPTSNFDALWNDFDQIYALFDVRGVDWDSLYSVYRPRVHDAMSDAELAEVMCEMLTELDDGHVTLKAEDLLYCISDSNGDEPYFPDGEPGSFTPEFRDQNVVITKEYLGRWDPMDWSITGLLKVPPEGDEIIGYLWLHSFGHYLPWDELEAWLGQAQEFDALVIDLRNNPGGWSDRQRRMVDLVADAARPYMQSRQRSGPAHGDFEPEVVVSMTPLLPGFADKPLVVITDPFTASAAEWFTMAAWTMPHATVIGDTTRGIYSGKWDRVLPNTWEYSSSGMVVRDMEGVTWEGVGFPPEVQVRNTLEANQEKKDLALDEALRILLEELSP